jgi:AbiV family abortive infection protein
MPLEAHEILKGAYLAMEQAGRLLNDACLLFEHRRLSSSVVLAVFSVEEGGKAEKLLRLALAAAKQGPVEEATVERTVRSRHQMKIKWGRGPASFVEAVWTWGGSESEAELARRLPEKVETALTDAPQKDHAARLRALFVDFDDGRWHRPAETTANDAFKLVLAAAIEYGTRRGKFLKPSDPFVQESLERMALPSLPDPTFPGGGRIFL